MPQLLLVANLSPSQMTEVYRKLEDIHDELQKQISALCACEFTPQHITTGELQCFTSSDEVTYRTRLSGTASVTSSEILSYLEEWITSGNASILVQGFRLNLDSSCLPVAIEALSDPECGIQESSQTDKTGSDNTTLIFVGTAGTLVLVLVILSLVIIFLLAKNRRRAAFLNHKK